MGRRIGVVALAVTLLATGTAIGAWQGRPVPPEAENRPGFPTIARVWIQNAGPAEAVPVRWEGRNTEPVWVDFRGRAVEVLASRQAWEYRQLLADQDDLAAELNRLGNDGWEAISSTDRGGQVQVLLKRPE